MKKIRVRFNLGRGVNYMKWKVQYPNGSVEYYTPSEVQLIMRGVVLKNHKKVAEGIYNGGEKVVCAWVLCDTIEVVRKDFRELDNLGFDRIRYNPRVRPNWLINDEVVDGFKMLTVGSVDFGLYKIN